MKRRFLFPLLTAALLLQGCATLERLAGQPATLGPAKGSLIIVGGGGMPKVIFDRFFEAAGGRDAKLVVVPTAGSGAEYDESTSSVKMFKKAGATNVHLLHTRDTKVADSEEFVAVLRDARAVWFGGGRQWRLADAYLGTKTEAAFHDVLKRGGVIGGSSAGATIQASYLVRGAPEGNQIMMSPGHEQGFAYIRNSAIDQHLLARKRENDMLPVIRKHPHLLGIGIDESTALYVRGNTAEVIGKSKVLFYDIALEKTAGKKFYTTLDPGDRFDLKSRRKLPIK
ncbi:MAG: peptidase S51 [Verrucomicrobia bacterium]|nr:MAG: peptidase S51 [Verrucomicrobiota bacterium]